ncbi:GYF domain-containing protein [Planctomyces sp. SH-PL14]|uniref:GYF domain-containing protein n=1 Tax=Planctomyces sp. SH-PL14 TaxID=1632864 RepID=UPI00078D25AE|nr:GYF domain-containing protein [Planctomyces sp. SH-PL14]AMV18440.1 serine endoprotease [Planctomyces sp. SH-PL14]
MTAFGMDQTRYFIRIRGQVKGPYSVEQLCRMAGRGQFSKLHQVSVDQFRWSPATEMTQVFQAKTASGPQEAVPPGAAAGIKEWYYNAGESKIGPVDEAFIKDLIAKQMISRETLVWKAGLPSWLEARQFFPNSFAPSKASRGRWIATVAGIVAALVVVVGGGIWFFRSPSSSAMAKADKTSSGKTVPAKAGSGVLIANSRSGGGSESVPAVAIESTDLSDEAVNAAVNSATGMVVAFLSIDLETGEHHEENLGHGTCFSVTADGIALTNRHVIDDHRAYLKSTPEGRVSRLTSSLKASYGIKREAGRIAVDKDGKPQPDPEMHAIIDAYVKKIDRIKPVLMTYFGGKGFPSELVHTSRRFDMAVLKIERTESPYFALSNSSTTAKLSAVLAFGFPGVAQLAVTDEEQAIAKARSEPKTAAELFFGKESHRDTYKTSGFELTPTPGEISVVQEESGGLYNAQHTAPIRPGNSGGPLVFRNGQSSGVVYGINTMYLKNDSPVYIAFPVAQMRQELEGDGEEEAGLTNLTWR